MKVYMTMNNNYLYIALNNIFTILFAMHPYFVYQLDKMKKSSNKNFKTNILWLALIVPPLWLLINNELTNFLMVLFVLSVYYFINRNLNR